MPSGATGATIFFPARISFGILAGRIGKPFYYSDPRSKNMIRRTIHIASWLCLSIVGTASLAFAEVKAVEKTTHGKPVLKTIEVISFGPQGLLLIGDGGGKQIVGIATGDTKPQAPVAGKVADIQGKLAARLGAKPDGITILDLAVNPLSGKTYLAVRKEDDKSYVILTVTGEGMIDEFGLDSVDYVRIPLQAANAAEINKITDVAWADDRLIAAASASEEFASKIFTIMAPLKHEAPGALSSAETYHVAHHKWETKAPMSVIVPYKEDDKMYVVGAFACTPVVKYPIDDIAPGAKVKGTSVIELGSGNRPLDMLTYEKDGKEYVLANTLRFHHARKPFGPSPYWTVKFERDLLGENQNVNEKALLRLKDNSIPATDRIVMVESMHGVTQMDRLGPDKLVVLRTAGEKGFDLEVAPLP